MFGSLWDGGQEHVHEKMTNSKARALADQALQRNINDAPRGSDFFELGDKRSYLRKFIFEPSVARPAVGATRS